jgi:cytochrome c oxidase cbb3-type subunit 3
VGLLLGIMFLLSGTAAAQQDTSGMDGYVDYALFVFLFLFIVTIFVFITMYQKPAADEKASPFWQNLKKKLTDMKPVEKEKDIMLDHDFDGITELDNSLPPWWLWLFYVTIVIAVGYMLYYHVFDIGKLQVAEYNEEVMLAEAEIDRYMKLNAIVTLETVTQLTDDAALLQGKNIFMQHCAACHNPDGGGLVGPNLTDEYWIHGGGIKNIFRTVRDGVPEKGMVPWGNQLSPNEMQQVASFVMSLKGTTPVGGKPPEGEIWTGDEGGADGNVETADSTSVEEEISDAIDQTGEEVSEPQETEGSNADNGDVTNTEM